MGIFCPRSSTYNDYDDQPTTFIIISTFNCVCGDEYLIHCQATKHNCVCNKLFFKRCKASIHECRCGNRFLKKCKVNNHS
jgi:hypothetical protein